MPGRPALVAVVLAFAVALTSVTIGAAAPTNPSKKRCKLVTKIVHGKKKRVRVCRTPPPTIDHPAPAPAVGTQARPAPVGKAVKVDANWRVQVLGADPNRTQEIIALHADDPDNPSPPLSSGMQYLLARVQVTRVSASAGTFSPYSFELRTPAGAHYDAGCGTFPEGLDASDLAQDQSATGNACWTLPSGDVGKVSMLYTDPFTGRVTYFSLGL